MNKTEILNTVIGVVKKMMGGRAVNAQSKFADDLGFDSLNEVDLQICLDDEFSIELQDSAFDKILTVQDAAELVAKTMSELFNGIKAGLEEAVALDIDKINKAVADLVDALNGCGATLYSEDGKICVVVKDVVSACPECNGLGYEPDNPDYRNKCAVCRGTGHV